MTKIYKKLCFVGLLAVMAMLTACEDAPLYTPADVAEGEGVVEVEATFKNFTPALASRTAGDAIQAIEKLTLFIYNTDGTPFELGGVFPVVIDKEDFESSVEKPDSESDYRVKFLMNIPNGQYRIYALANMDYKIKLKPGETFLTEQALLESTTPEWDSAHPEKNNQMFGFLGGEPVGDEGQLKLAPVVTVNGSTQLHVWLRRCASKVTFQYDGSQLYDGVYIYLMSAKVMDIPSTCTLGVDNKVTYEGAIISLGDTLDYFNSNTPPTLQDFMNPSEGIVITKNGAGEHSHQVWPADKDVAHSEKAKALFFYENMQGTVTGNRKPQQFPAGQTEGDLLYNFKDGIEFGTYIEVEALYYADIKGVPGVADYNSSGVIKYRFMLGKNIINDFNAERNHHYKLTLGFKGKGNEVDWHIEYADPTLLVTQPKIFDYQGRVFVPQSETIIPNRGHNFIKENRVTVTSYMSDGMDKLNSFTVEYSPHGKTPNDPPEWLNVKSQPSVTGNPYDVDYIFSLNEDKIEYDRFKVADLFNPSLGNSQTNPCNLADPSRPCVSPSSAAIVNTANCYIIDAPGWYMLPLVYGNAIEDTKAYNSGLKGEYELEYFKDYLGKDIKSPYIKDSGTPKCAFMAWEDTDALIEYNPWKPGWNPAAPEYDIVYLPDAYNKKGGIMFHVPEAKEGNAVLAITDEEYKPVSYIRWHEWKDEGTYPLPRAMWSWHIWVTGLFSEYKSNKQSAKGLKSEDRTITVAGSDTTNKFQLMPVNLGWCSEGGDITYYPERSCKVKFTSGPLTREINIVQKSHIAMPRGNNPYYQWGRKDPFWGTADKASIAGLDLNVEDALDKLNKTIYFTNAGYGGTLSQFLPERITRDQLTNEEANDSHTTVDDLAAKRLTTIQALATMIQYPWKWHNPPRTGVVKNYKSNDKTYVNLWDGTNNSVNGWTAPVKTIYDPCPVGYQVPSFKAFSGFAYRGLDASDSDRWYDVREDHIQDYNKVNGKGSWASNNEYLDQVFEFYTTPDKYQSIVFPQNGYRDWDSFAYIYKVGKNMSIGYCWSANLVGGNDHNKAYNFEVTRKDETTTGFIDGKPLDQSFVRPQNPFYPCDGMPIRPCKQ